MKPTVYSSALVIGYSFSRLLILYTVSVEISFVYCLTSGSIC